MEENVTLDFNKALQALEQVAETFTVDSWVPSLQTFIKFKQLDAKQQKELLGSVIDTSVYNTNFIKTFYNIIKNNILTDNINIDNFTLIDKTVIGLYLKSQISEELTVVFNDENKTTEKFNLISILNNLKSYKTPLPVILEDKSQTNSLKIEITYPTIKIEYDYDSQNKNNKKVEDVKTTEDIQKLVTETFLSELSKYIFKIWINDTEIPIVGMSFVQKTRLIEKLPSTLIQKIIDNIGIWKSEIDGYLTVKHDSLSKVISLDGSLFLS